MILNPATKRTLQGSGSDQKRFKPNDNTVNLKTLCSYRDKSAISSHADEQYYSSSSSSEDEGEECDKYNSHTDYTHHQVIGSPHVDSNTSKAICQYSSDDEDDSEHDVEDERNSSSILNTDYNQRRSTISNSSGASSKTMDERNSFLTNKRYSINVAELVSTKTSSPTGSNEDFQQYSTSHDDHKARTKCLDYVINAIDDVWSRYCDCVSYEEEVEYYEKSESSCCEDDGYKTELSNYTSVTEYDDNDMVIKNHPQKQPQLQQHRPSMSIMNTCQPTIMKGLKQNDENVKLQQLKDRLIKAKYYLEDLVDSFEVKDCILFWKKWDLIKYSIVEIVEEDEEDDIIERKIEELELGRYVGSF